jgi:hypothetical protein
MPSKKAERKRIRKLERVNESMNWMARVFRSDRWMRERVINLIHLDKEAAPERS